jgi:hypothetical protein
MFGASERLPAIGVCVVQDLNEKIAGIDGMMRRLSIALHVLKQSQILVALYEQFFFNAHKNKYKSVSFINFYL